MSATYEPAQGALFAFVLLEHLYRYHLTQYCEEQPGTPTLLEGMPRSAAEAIQDARFALINHLQDRNEGWPLSHVLATARLCLSEAEPTAPVPHRLYSHCVEILDESLTQFDAVEVATALYEAPNWISGHWEAIGRASD